MNSSRRVGVRAFLRTTARATALALAASTLAFGATPLILRNADRNENSMINGQLVSTLIGNVVFDYDELTISSDWARSWHESGGVERVVLRDNVRAENDELTLTCDHLTFRKKSKELSAAGNVDFVNHAEQVRITGSRGRYDIPSKRFRLTGSPKFFRYDAAAGDTLCIVSEEMTYSDSLKQAVARRNVRITQGKLLAVCDLARHYPDGDRSELRGSPRITYEGYLLDGDSVNLVMERDSLRGVVVMGNAHGRQGRDDDGRDSGVTHMWGDSMYMALTDGGRLDTIWSHGDVRSVYSLSAAGDSANEVTGKSMKLAFDRDGALLRATVWGNAESIYYVNEQADGRGRNEASGDSIEVYFNAGKARQLVLKRSVRGVYYPAED